MGSSKILRTEPLWRDLPERYGSWRTIYRRFRRWQQVGVWERNMTELHREATEAEQIVGTLAMIDSSSILAHQRAACDRNKGALPENAWDEAAMASAARCI